MFYNPETGVSEVCPVNVNGNWSASANLWLSHSIKKFRLLSRIGGSYSHQVALLNEGRAWRRKRVSHPGAFVQFSH